MSRGFSVEMHMGSDDGHSANGRPRRDGGLLRKLMEREGDCQRPNEAYPTNGGENVGTRCLTMVGALLAVIAPLSGQPAVAADAFGAAAAAEEFLPSLIPLLAGEPAGGSIVPGAGAGTAPRAAAGLTGDAGAATRE